MIKRITKLGLLIVLVLTAATFSYTTLTASAAAQIGGVSISETDMQTAIQNCIMTGETTVDLNEVTYQIAANKIMRERIRGTAYDIPQDYDDEIYAKCLEKASDNTPETLAYLEKLQVSNEEFADIMFQTLRNAKIRVCYVDLVAPQIAGKNPGVTDQNILIDKIDEHVKALVDEMPSIEFNQQSVNRISKFAEERHIQIIQ